MIAASPTGEVAFQQLANSVGIPRRRLNEKNAIPTSMHEAERLRPRLQEQPKSELAMAFRALIFCLMFCLSPAAAGTIAASERPTVAPVLRKVTPGVNIATRRVETVTTKPIHPQTILAHSLNDEALSVGHGRAAGSARRTSTRL